MNTSTENFYGLGEKIKKIRQLKGLTQREYGDLLGVKQGHVSALEKGESYPSKTLILHMCNIFRVNSKWLLGDDGDIFIEDVVHPADSQANIDWEILQIIIESSDDFYKQIGVKVTEEEKWKEIKKLYLFFYDLQNKKGDKKKIGAAVRSALEAKLA